MVMLCLKLASVLILAEIVNCKMEPFILDGKVANIKSYPHSVYLKLICMVEYMCGGSILNQRLVLTAAHCLEECSPSQIRRFAYIKYGHELLDNMGLTSVADFVMHEDYDTSDLYNDIALVTTKQPIQLGKVAKRVAVMQSPPIDVKMAYIAGWGVMNELQEPSSVLLETAQQLYSLDICQRYMGRMPQGTLCAGPVNGRGVPNQGDSGSALMVDNYIQVGLVSYKLSVYPLVVYTNVSYHYDWIMRHSSLMTCKELNSRG